MLGWLRSFYRDPDLWAVPSMENQRLGFDHIVGFSIGDNEETPRVGDVIIILHVRGCMAEEVYRDERVRVVGPGFDQREKYGPRADSIMVVPTTNGFQSIGNLRRHGKVPRTWVMIS